MNTGYNREGEYDHYVVEQGGPLLDWLLKNLGQSRSKVKATLQGRGIKVNGKTVSQFDFPLEPGMKVAVSRTKRNQKGFKSRWVRIVYEDRWLIVVEKAEGILSMAGGHAALNVWTDGLCKGYGHGADIGTQLARDSVRPPLRGCLLG